MAECIVVFGLPGSGKSYFAERLARRLNAEYLSSDRLRNRMLDAKTYSESEKDRVYHQMIAETKHHMAEGRSIVLDATFYRKAHREAVRKAAGDALVYFIEVTASEELIRERTSRERPDSDADYSVYRKVRRAFEPMDKRHLVLESGRDNIDVMLAEALDWLKQEGSASAEANTNTHD